MKAPNDSSGKGGVYGQGVFRPNAYDSPGVHGGYSHPTERRMFLKSKSPVHAALRVRPPHEAQILANRAKFGNSKFKFGMIPVKQAATHPYRPTVAPRIAKPANPPRIAIPAAPRLQKPAAPSYGALGNKLRQRIKANGF